MPEFDDAPGDTGASTGVLESSPDSAPSSTEPQSSAVSPTSDLPPGEPSAPGPVPYDRFADVNSKYDKVRWAEAYGDPERVRQQLSLVDWLDRDPVGFYRYYETQLQQHGYLPRPQAQPEPQLPEQPPPPDYQYRDANGQVQTFYSADRLRQVMQWQEARLAQRIGPLEQHLATQQTQARAQQEASRILADAETWPYFADHKADIWQAMQANPQLSLEAAYRSVVIPAIEGRTRQQVLTDVSQKPGATTTSPTQAQPQGGEDLQKLPLTALFRREMRRRGFGT